MNYPTFSDFLNYKYCNYLEILKLTNDKFLFSSYQINVSLLIFSLAGFLLPGYLFYHRRNLVQEKASRDKAIFENQALNQSEANGINGHGPQEA